MTGMVMLTKGGVCGGGGGGKESRRAAAEEQQNQLSLVALLLAALRKSMVSCRVLDQGGGEDQLGSRSSSSAALHHMEIGWPTNVQHLTHVTFDRFHGFLGLPVEFQVEIPCRVPSASISVFGVSAESMQCSYDSRGNSVPTILLLMQERLYTQGGLKAEGIFRINPENSKEEHVRDQLNRGTVPCNIDVHCLAGLIKAWFRELPTGVLDGLSPEEVLQCNTEEESVELVKQLQPTETELLNWAIDLMADVVEQEESNKMNARNIAMVFAPNMTQMSDPLTALMHAVQVMNLLKTLIMKTLREREETTTGGYSPMSSCSSDRQTVEEVDSQQEMNISCELRRLPSDHDEQVDFNTSSESEDEVESLGGIEECFLEHLDENENAKNNIREELEGDSQIELAPSPGSGSTLNRESAVSLCDGRISSSRLSTSDGEDSGLSSIETEFKVDAKSSSKLSEITSDVCMVEKLVNPGFPVPLCVSSRYA